MFVFVLITGCSTAAQRQASLIQENNAIALQKMKDCMNKIVDNPEYQSLKQHIPIQLMPSWTLEQLADSRYPSDEEIKKIIALHNNLALCRELHTTAQSEAIE
jgi:hypothetical protein